MTAVSLVVTAVDAFGLAPRSALQIHYPHPLSVLLIALGLLSKRALALRFERAFCQIGRRDRQLFDDEKSGPRRTEWVRSGLLSGRRAA